MNKANSFDVFDTIIARRCIYPNYIFFHLEEACGVKGLCRSRIMASCLAAVKQEMLRSKTSFEEVRGSAWNCEEVRGSVWKYDEAHGKAMRCVEV